MICPFQRWFMFFSPYQSAKQQKIFLELKMAIGTSEVFLNQRLFPFSGHDNSDGVYHNFKVERYGYIFNIH